MSILILNLNHYVHLYFNILIARTFTNFGKILLYGS
jgi:hypothetical protein